MENTELTLIEALCIVRYGYDDRDEKATQLYKKAIEKVNEEAQKINIKYCFNHIEQIKKQSSIEYFHDAVIDMMARRRPINTNEAAKILMEAQKLHEQEIIDAWVDSAQYGMKQDDINIMDSDEPQLAQIYYNNKYKI
jgi:hypothetical protein